MPLYESTFIARHEMSTQQVEGLAGTFADIIKENGGEVSKTEHWGLRNLAYRVKKNRKGHYVFFNIDAPSAAIQEFERNLRLNEDVLRYLTVRVEELDPNPSPVMQSRAPRDDRARRGGPHGGRDRGDGAKSEADESNKTDTTAAGTITTVDAEPAKTVPTKKTATKPATPEVAETAEPDQESKTGDEAVEPKPASKAKAKAADTEKGGTAKSEPAKKAKSAAKDKAPAKTKATAKEKAPAKTKAAAKEKAPAKATTKAKPKAPAKAKSKSGDSA